MEQYCLALNRAVAKIMSLRAEILITMFISCFEDLFNY